MSPYSTSSPSIEQTRLYLTRPPSGAWTWWNRMSLSSVAEYSFTPMLTRPKDTAPRQIDRMPPLPSHGSRPSPRLMTGQDQQDRGGQVPAAGRPAAGLPRTGDALVGEDGDTPLDVAPSRARTALPGSGGRDRPSVPSSALAVLPGQRAVLDRVVDELQHVGAGHR